MKAIPFLANVAEAVGAPATSWEGPAIVIFKLLAVALLVLLNGFFVASEFAIVKVRASQLDTLVAQGIRSARLARHVTSHLDAYLSATQLGITLASLVLAGWASRSWPQMIEPFFALAKITSPVLIETTALALAFGTITILHIVLGELAPKSLAIRKAVPMTLWISQPLTIFYVVFKPAIWLLNGLANWLLKRIFHRDPVAESELAHSEEELRLILDESAKAAHISRVSQEIVANAFEMRRRLVREVMTPRGEVVYLDIGLSFRDNLQRAKAARHTRFPLCAGRFDHAIGLIHIKDMLAQLDELEPSLLVDEFGANVGIVTLQQIIAEVIRDMPDEFGLERREFQRLGEDEFLADGSLAIHEMRDLAGLEWKDDDVTTVGGYLVRRLGHLPRVGEQLRIDGYIVTIEQADGRKVQQARFDRVAKRGACER